MYLIKNIRFNKTIIIGHSIYHNEKYLPEKKMNSRLKIHFTRHLTHSNRTVNL